jgi:hypothetical protein
MASGSSASITRMASRPRDRDSSVDPRRSITGIARKTIPDGRMPSKDAATLIDDFFDEVERALRERGIGMDVIEVEETGGSNDED